MRIGLLFPAIVAMLGGGAAACAQSAASDEDWIQLFNGRDLSGWTPKITKHELGDNYANTFRVEDGRAEGELRPVREFRRRFGHLFYEDAVQVLPARHRVSLRRRAGPARPRRLGASQQRRDDPFAGSAHDAAGSELSDLDRSAVPRRTERRQAAADAECVLAGHGDRLSKARSSRRIACPRRPARTTATNGCAPK